jgi:UDP-glucose:(heptosyl)LPS alpha-1,3-glucosyltransferase
VGSYWRDLSFARAVQQAVKDGAYDLVQSHERVAGCDIFRAGDGVHATWLDQRARADSAAKRVGAALDPHHQFILAEEARMFADARLKVVICNSRMVQADIEARFAIARSKLPIIYNAVDGERFHPRERKAHKRLRNALNLPHEARVLMYVGGGFARKGVAQIIRALSKVECQAHAVVVGDDKQSSRYIDLARKLGVQDRLHLTGAVPDTVPYYGIADLFVLPTLYDPFPNAALEALSTGVPVITSTTCGAAELITEGQAGYCVDALDVDGLAHRINTFFALDDAGRTAMSAAARSAATPFTPARMASAYLALYRDLLGESASASAA